MQTAPQILEQLDKIRSLPTLPTVVQEIGKTVRDPNADAASLAKLLSDDPAIMARIMKVVNSALYAGAEQVTSVQQAVARMGMTTVNNIALSTSVFSAFNGDGKSNFDRTAFWRHSISTGIAATVIYDRIAQNMSTRYPKDVLRLAGLIHDMGKIILDQYYTDQFAEAIALSASEKIPLFQAEKQIIGANHAEIGAWLGVKWNLDRDLLHAMRWHHNPQLADDSRWEIAALCHTANYVCNLQRIGDSGDSASPQFLKGVWKRLGLSIGDISDVVDEIEEESQHSDILMAFVGNKESAAKS